MCRLARVVYQRVFRRYTGKRWWVLCEDPDEPGYWWERR